MSAVTISLLEGFDDDEVVVSVDGVEVARRHGVTSRMLLGLAERFDVEVPEGAGVIELAIPAKGLTAVHATPLEGTALLASVEDRELVLLTSRGGEGYM